RIRAAHHPHLEIRHAAWMEPGRPIDVYGLVGPFAGEAELAPGADVLLCAAGGGFDPRAGLPAAGPRAAVDSVVLLQRECRERIVLVHECPERGRLAAHVETACRDFDLDRVEL